MKKKWCAQIFWWRGESQKPRKNQKVTSHIVRAKTLEELEEKLAHKRFKRFELVGEQKDPGGYFSQLLQQRLFKRHEAQKKHPSHKFYEIQWTIELHAKNAREATEKAKKHMQNPHFKPTVREIPHPAKADNPATSQGEPENKVLP